MSHLKHLVALHFIPTPGEIDFVAKEGATYYIRVLVSTLYTAPESGGGFGITVVSSELPSNDKCAGALTLQPGETTPSSTVGASAEDITCNPFHFNTTGVWFKFLGDGANHTASTCVDDAGDIDSSLFNAQIDLFAGDNCGNLVCVSSNDRNNEDRTCNDGVSYVWNTIEA